MSYKPVDTAITIVVGPCIDNSDFKTLEESIAYNAAGMDVSLIVEKTDGTTTVTAITLTTGGTSDWTHKDGAYYEVEITAAQNAEEGIAYLRGVCTGVLPFESVHYDIVKANVYDSWVKGTDVLQVDLTQIGGATQSATDLKDFADEGYDPATNKVQGVILTDTTTTNTDMVGTDNAALAATALTDVTWTDAKAGYLDAAITSRSTVTTGQVNDQVVDVMKTDTTSEMSQGAPPATPTFEEMIAYIYFRLRNKTTTTASEDAMWDDAGTTKLIKATISDNGTTFEKSEYVSGA